MVYWMATRRSKCQVVDTRTFYSSPKSSLYDTTRTPWKGNTSFTLQCDSFYTDFNHYLSNELTNSYNCSQCTFTGNNIKTEHQIVLSCYSKFLEYYISHMYCEHSHMIFVYLLYMNSLYRNGLREMNELNTYTHAQICLYIFV